jgi:hypothetical protein
MKYTVELVIQEDDATGEYGLVHKGTQGMFNSFWGADGIFHDVFEHYFENSHPYFNNQYAFQMWGEMAASGHAIAYSDIGINNFMYRRNSIRDYIVDTSTRFLDWLHNYTDDLDFLIDHICVPYQRPLKKTTLNYWLTAYKNFLQGHCSDGRNRAKLIKMANIRRCYTWGYKQAQTIIGKDKDYAYDVLFSFLERWNKICTIYNPKSLGIIVDEDEHGYYSENYGIKSLNFEITTGDKLQIHEYIVENVTYNQYPTEQYLTSF